MSKQRNPAALPAMMRKAGKHKDKREKRSKEPVDWEEIDQEESKEELKMDDLRWWLKNLQNLFNVQKAKLHVCCNESFYQASFEVGNQTIYGEPATNQNNALTSLKNVLTNKESQPPGK